MTKVQHRHGSAELDAEWLTPELQLIEEWVKYRAKGWHYTEIARRWPEYKPGDIRRAVDDYNAAWVEADQEKFRKEIEQKLIMMERRLWEQFEGEEGRDANDTAKTLLKIQETRAKLHGLEPKGDIIINQNAPSLVLQGMTKDEILALASRPLLSELAISGESRPV